MQTLVLMMLRKITDLARYRNIEPESALFLAMQIRLKQAKQILEIGTSTGYSTLWLAECCAVYTRACRNH